MSSEIPDISLFDDRLPIRLWSKVVPEPNSGCWLWIGASPGEVPQIRWKVISTLLVSAVHFGKRWKESR
jgi:hypothetical protein